MDYKEKYEQAMEVAQRFYNNSVAITKKGLEDIFPELKESDDERIRKEIIDFATKANNGFTSILANNYNFNKWLAWLEKQGEQKPAWSEEDENLFRCAIDAVKQESKVRTDGCLDEEVGGMVIDWLKSLKDRVQPQPKQEWSEDDERYLNNTISYLKDATEFKETAKLCIDWLKSLRPQNTWKPSDEQMVAIQEAINIVGVLTITGSKINSLYQDLKKLREG